MHKHLSSSFALIGALLFTSLSTPAFSDPAEDMTAWKQEASQLVSQKMTYPFNRTMNRSVLHEVDILINASGEILNAGEIEGKGQNFLRKASKRTVEKLGRLPALPASFESDTAVVKVRMIYASSEQGLQRILKQLEQRRPSVRIQDVASKDTPVITLAAN